MSTSSSLSRHAGPEFLADPDWWRQAVVYEIYVRSFADSNADGIGDINGITSRVSYLASLGIDAVWLSPFYPSALADGGYDVDDYRNVDPKLGTLADFDVLIAALHAVNIKLVVDIVPNHSSNRHRWFLEALACPKGSPARDRYIFREGAGEDGSWPPTDWESLFSGGPSWTRVPDGQWYLHLFAPEQPDLNWNSREVRDDFLKTLRFWSDRGVDGFRVDVAHCLAKDLTEPLLNKEELPNSDARDGSHPLWDRDEVHEIYAEWRKVLDEYDPPRTAVAEAVVHSSRRARYASPNGLGQAFNFDLMNADFDAVQFQNTIIANLAEAKAAGASMTWVLSSHDSIRHATRYGMPDDRSVKNMGGRPLSAGTTPRLDVDLGVRRARAATLLMLALPGSAYLYQGEELGLHQVADIPDQARQDPIFFRTAGAEKGRDGCRVPIPWTADGLSFGFGNNGAHLPQPAWFTTYSVQTEEDELTSTLHLYRRALDLRHRLQAGEELEWVASDVQHLLHFVRPNGWQSVTNFGSELVTLPDGAVVITSSPLIDGKLPPDSTAWIT